MTEGYLDISAEELRTIGGSAFTILAEEERILAVRGMPEIHLLRQHLLDCVRARSSAAIAREIETFFDTRASPSDEGVAILLRILMEVRDSRCVSALFAPTVAGLGLPEPILIDTGHFRFLLPRDYERLWLRTDLFTQEDLTDAAPRDPENFIRDRRDLPRPHRDIDRPHYTFQLNLWFPLHATDERHTLILYPEAYRRDVPYYYEPEDLAAIDSWGYGRALQVPLAFGDALLFHSQQVHASPTQAPGENRLSVELRMAGGCIDDNSRTYRELFWNLRNFEHGDGPGADRGDSAEHAWRLHSLARPPGRARADAESPQVRFNRLFRTYGAARKAANLGSSDSVFSQALPLDRKKLGRLAASFRRAPFAEDRQLALARLSRYRGADTLADKILADALARTKSYFWALEVGRLAGAAARFRLAARAFAKAEALAGSSRLAIGQYVAGVPCRSEPSLQLLPPQALRAAHCLRAKAASLAAAGGEPGQAALLDYRLFYVQPSVKRSFEHGDVIETGSLYVGLPLDRFYHPETIVGDPSGIAFGDSEQAVLSAIHPWRGAALAETRSMNPDLLCAYRGYNVVSYLHGIYCAAQRIGPVDFFFEDPLDYEDIFVVLSEQAAKAAIDRILGPEKAVTPAR